MKYAKSLLKTPCHRKDFNLHFVNGSLHIYIATQNDILTFYVGGEVLNKSMWRFEKMRSQHIFHSPKLTENFDKMWSNVYRSSVQYLNK